MELTFGFGLSVGNAYVSLSVAAQPALYGLSRYAHHQSCAEINSKPVTCAIICQQGIGRDIKRNAEK